MARKKSSIADYDFIAFQPTPEDTRLLVKLEKEMMKERGTNDPCEINNTDVIRRAFHGH